MRTRGQNVTGKHGSCARTFTPRKEQLESKSG
jgi:hypothetical protein